MESTWTYNNWLRRQEENQIPTQKQEMNLEKAQELGLTSTTEAQVFVGLKIEGLVISL